ncbi:glycosaminoglycan xylosylkinase-like isoform X2 [Apostichopus japonicus]
MRLKKGNVLLFSFGLVSVWLFIIVLTPAPDATHKSSYHRELMADLKARHDSVTKPVGDEKSHKKVKMKADDTNLVDSHVKISQKRDKRKKVNEAGHFVPKKVKVGDKVSLKSSKNETKPVTVQWEANLAVLHKAKTKAAYTKLWKKAASWVQSDQINLPGAEELGSILHGMSTAKIKKADIGYKGTQLKARLVLEGGQMVVFKPKWYRRDEVMTGNPYSGKDRHNGEIAAFHLNRILGFNRAPLVAGRRVNLLTEVFPVATPTLNATFTSQNNNTCFYGKCYYCKPSDPACAEGDIMEGSLTLWLPAKYTLQRWKHPWARTYRSSKKARWEEDDAYCDEVKKTHPIERQRLLLDIIDTAVFDYLIGNADRHMFETFEADEDPMLLLLDNGKSFGNPYWDEGSILAPVKQCCIIRNQTWTILQEFKERGLSDAMRQVLSHDPVSPVLSELHLQALDRRLIDISEVVNACITEKGQAVLI